MIPLVIIGAILRWACPVAAGGVKLHLIGDWCLWIGGLTTIPFVLWLGACIYIAIRDF